LTPARRVERLERTLIRRIFDDAPPGAINLGLGQPDLPTPPELCLAGVQGIANGRTGYTSTAGETTLRRAVARRYPGLATGADNVLITVGSQEAIYLGCLVLTDPGAEILCPDPGYPAYPRVARLLGAEPVAYPLHADREFRLLARDVIERLSDRTGLVVLSAPSNPTGACHRTEELRALVEELRRRGIPWLSDEVYGGLTYGEEPATPWQLSPESGVVVAGLSKEQSMTGWRIGWLVGPGELMARATAAHQLVVTCAPAVSQQAALAAFTDAGRARMAGWAERLSRRRMMMARALEAVPRVRFALPDGAFYFFVDVSEHGAAEEVARRLVERQGVITIPGTAFGAKGEGYLRLSFAASEADIERGVGLIAAELAG
jgi:aspartate aminotransferase